MGEAPLYNSARADHQTYRWVGVTLTAGMYASFAAMGAGLVWWLVAGAPGGVASASSVVPLEGLLPELGAGNPLALLNLGVLMLLATPGVTLLAQIITYAAARNWRFAGIGALVAAILLLSLALSLKWIPFF
ncbi:MAG: DUF1634 domain-containing protein [Chloroflexota bacterium]|nr:DUF1634 domain-containing protein [Chloroflexota bacterium]